ncbi:IQ and AAA domain-containing protein 1-like isoform X2 [Choristoneura fumiferana]|uniref:IQ and AAA domain-containing protein 1-like isoform X2 n=1 Tax=Choristoneura fumiferana TaxID=7141 RepID=UPI003D158F64
MSNDYYFHKWKSVLHHLKTLAQLDQEYQNTKIHDKKRCQAVERLSGMLGAYINIYNDALECSQQNLQVQKKQNIDAVVKAIVGRILELKQQLRKIEGCQVQFLSQGLIQHKLTTDDAEFQDIPFKVEREDYVNAMILEAFSKAKEKLKEKGLELMQKEEQKHQLLEEENVVNWWEEEVVEEVEEVRGLPLTSKFTKIYEVSEVVSEETLFMRKMLALIQAHERSRQVTLRQTSKKQRREIWVKELEGTLHPQPRIDLKVRAAELIQKIARLDNYRAYMEFKRKKLKECRTDEVLGIRMCKETSYDARVKADEIKEHRHELFKQFDRDWKEQCAEIKENFMKRKRDEISEDYRDNLRDWFYEWYTKIKFFHDIPNESKGGSAVILRAEIPEPHEWLEQYEAYLEDQKKNKNKSPQQIKFEKMEAKKEQMRAKKEQQMKKKMEEQLMKKIMKNPNMHPGYDYPESKKTHNILQALDHYHTGWDELDAGETVEVKERNIKELDAENMYMEVKLEIIPEVDVEMKQELKKLKIALKKDYVREGETMPEGIKEKQRVKKKKRLKVTVSELIAEKMEHLAEMDIFKEYPKTKIEDFKGDHNFAGDGFRCSDVPAWPFAGEIRSLWWDRCRELIHGSHKILIVGPRGCGRTKLVHAMATTNDAVLFELDPQHLSEFTPEQVQHAAAAVASCARAAQPAVIYLKHAHLLYYKRNKAPPGEELNADISDLIRRYITKKIIKRIQKSDNVTIIATCSNPWLMKNTLLKQFPEVILIPDSSYSVVMQLVHSWVTTNHSIPRDFDVHSLARILRGYGYSAIQAALQHFLEPEQVVKIAVNGLSAMEILNYVLQTEVEKNDYEKYVKWYSDNTVWGKKEKKQLEEAREFKAVAEKYAEKKKKKKTTAPSEVSTT